MTLDENFQTKKCNRRSPFKLFRACGSTTVEKEGRVVEMRKRVVRREQGRHLLRTLKAPKRGGD